MAYRMWLAPQVKMAKTVQRQKRLETRILIRTTGKTHPPRAMT